MPATTQAELSGPNPKALRRITAALFTAAVLCFAICVTLIARAKPQAHAKHTAARCVCGGQCLRWK